MTPDITGYRIEEVLVPAPQEPEQIILEVLGLAATSPTGEPTRQLAITLDGGGFAITAMPYEITIAGRPIAGLQILGDGNQATGFIDAVPRDGDPIAIRMHGPMEEQVLLATFDRSKLDDRRIT